MLKRYTCLLLTLALFCAYSSYSFGQDAEKPAANNDALSLDGLMVDDPAPKSEPIKIDQELLTPPKNASVDELFEFIENLQDKLPEPKTQDDFIKIIDAYSQACLNVSELVLQKDELEPEQRERAVQLKVVALTTRMKTDPAAEAQLDQFVKENLDSAKSDEELIKAYQLKLQVLASKSDDLDEISAFADELYSKEKDELKVFAIEVKAQVFITGLQKDNEPNMKVLEFVDSVIADKNVAKRVKEKAYEMKLVGTIVLAQLQEDKEEADRDPKYEQEKEELFAKLLSDPEASIELKKDVYQLRVQTLFDQSGAITDDNESKIVDVAAKLLKEEDPELYLLGVAVKGRLLITKAQGNKDAVKELADFVDELNKVVEDKEDIKSSSEWNSLTTQIEDIQKQWRTIGFATKKENQKIYDRFRAACDKFFNRKREYYMQFKADMTENVNKKLALIEQAEALKDNKDWKKTTQDFINLQKQWKEIGTVPRKKSEQLWKRFRAACDAFFNERDKNVSPENDYYGNLKAKKAIIEEINAYEPNEDADVNVQAAKDFSDRWQSVGYVPFKEKDSIQKAFADAMQAKFPGFQARPSRGGGRGDYRRPMSEKERLVQQYNKLQQDIVTFENNIGFFSESKNSAPLIKQMQDKIEASKAELSELEAKIRKVEESEDQNQ